MPRYKQLTGQYKKSHPLYNIWSSMLKRCDSPSCRAYKDYGGRGITVDPRWRCLDAFAADMGPRPSLKHSIDRIDNDGGYSKENCRWATQEVQAKNTRIQKHCRKGHPWTEESTGGYLNPKTNKFVRHCKLCRRDRANLKYRAKSRHERSAICSRNRAIVKERRIANSKANGTFPEGAGLNLKELCAEIRKLVADNKTMKNALKSIAGSECCQTCQEAKLVASKALEDCEEVSGIAIEALKAIQRKTP